MFVPSTKLLLPNRRRKYMHIDAHGVPVIIMFWA
jgi:hypothetical protein